MTTGPALQDYAIQYAKREWFPFPCQVNGKQPATRRGLYAGTNDLVTIRQRWSTKPYNIGIWTGAAGLIVVDLDTDKKCEGFEPGISYWCRTCDRSGTDPFGTYCTVTAGGGMHVYYLHPEGVEIHPSVGFLSPLVDIRAMGSYVIAAGSVIDGIPYELVTDILEPAPMPEWLVEMLKYREPPEEVKMRAKLTQTKLAHNIIDIQEYVDKRIRRILDAWTHYRNNTLNAQSHGIFMAIPYRHFDSVEIALIDTGIMIGLSRAEATATVKSARRSAESKRVFGS